ncbi:TonB-dependent receptor [Seonamhaeicola sediminis]|uniref:TonB-dependent receptor n=1 Tax=Seonamhaeicola sediminis TaxID=2528206 RepID=A0A562YCA7_9FLAO|nr:TonB-dependent receptor [Seonamhaeicola sediminis]TWO32110.1 TonB-dependent receptor [Seonamhaeicola sediminis]
MKKQYVILFLAMVFSLIGFSQNGNIQGTIIDEKGLAVPFASVLLESLDKGVISDADGKFLFLNIPSGKQTIKVVYLGYSDTDVEVEVTEGITTNVTVTITAKALELDGVVINGYNSGQAKALNAQKNKQNITNVVSTDQIGKFPDANIGDAVKRIPGITMQVDQGEARNIIVRGLAPQLNSVTLNGSRIPSAEGDNRNIQMDLIPADMIQLIEVNKAVTPDMDGDALGGSVNLVTRTSPNGFRVAATAGSGVNFITNKRIVNGSFLIGDRTNNGKFGYMFSASINDTDFGSDNVEAEWVNEAESPLSGDDIEVDPFVEESDIRTYLVQRVRRSFSANFDYAFNPNNKLYLKTMYNWRDDRENRYRLRYRSIEPIFEDGTETITGFQGEIRRETKGGIDNDRNKNARLEDQRMQNYTFGGEHLIGKIKLDWMGSYASASEERLNERYIEYELEETVDSDPIPFNADFSNTRFPVIVPANSSDVLLSRYSLNGITEENQFTEEKDWNFFTNLQIPFSLVKEKEGFIKVGGRLRFKEKNRDNNFFEFSPETSNFDNLALLPLVDQTDADFLAGSQYVAGAYVDPEYLGSLDLQNSNLFESESIVDEFLSGNYLVKEDVYAGYAMINQQVSDKLSVLAGVRIENTEIETNGNLVVFDEDGDFDPNASGEIKDDNSYVNILPGVHFKYNVANNTVLRFAWTNTLARPNYIDLVPFRNVVREDEEVSIGNPELSATKSMNFDLMAEHYFKSVGLISAGVFHKNIQDFIYTSQFTDSATGFDAFQPQNGDDASITGAEVSFQRQLDFLPGFAKNLSVFLNYTYLSSSADGIRNEDGDERTDLDLPGTAPNMFNGSLSYGGKKLNLRLSLNFSDAYIDEIGGNAFEDRYYDQQLFLDFNASYAFSDNLRLYVDLNNITDQPLRYFQGVKSRTMQMEYYSQRLSVGLKYDLFKRKN